MALCCPFLGSGFHRIFPSFASVLRPLVGVFTVITHNTVCSLKASVGWARYMLCACMSGHLSCTFQGGLVESESQLISVSGNVV